MYRGSLGVETEHAHSHVAKKNSSTTTDITYQQPTLLRADPGSPPPPTIPLNKTCWCPQFSCLLCVHFQKPPPEQILDPPPETILSTTTRDHRLGSYTEVGLCSLEKPAICPVAMETTFTGSMQDGQLHSYRNNCSQGNCCQRNTSAKIARLCRVQRWTYKICQHCGVTHTHTHTHTHTC